MRLARPLPAQKPHFIPIDFDLESFQEKLSIPGLMFGWNPLFLLEEVLIYLRLDSFRQTMSCVQTPGRGGSRLTFYVVCKAVFDPGTEIYGRVLANKCIIQICESWVTGFSWRVITDQLAVFEFQPREIIIAETLEQTSFIGSQSWLLPYVNTARFLVTAKKSDIGH